MWKRRGLLSAGFACLAAGASGLRAQPAGAGSKIVIAVERRSSFCYLPLTIAERNGYFAAEGLDVTVREFPLPGAAVQAVLSGVAQVLSGPYQVTFDQQRKGLEHTAFVLQGRTPQLVLGVSHKAVPQFKGLLDLRGRRIGVMGIESASHRVARLLLDRVGLGLSGPSEVEYVGFTTPTEVVTAFHAGDIDAICFDEPVITLLEQSGALRVVADTRTVRGCTDVFGGPMPAGCLSAPTDFIDTQAKTCQSLAHAVVHALKWLQTAGPSDLIKAVPESFFMGDRALYLAAFSRAREAWTPDGMMPLQGPETAARMWLGHRSRVSGAADRLNLARTFTNEFARRAKARYKA